MSDERPQEPVWEAVMELERQHYTKAEIADMLRDVALGVETDAS